MRSSLPDLTSSVWRPAPTGGSKREPHRSTPAALLEAKEDGRNERREPPLEIRLEIDVVANLPVDLQPIPLAVGHDDPIGFWIEVYRRWEAEAIFGLQAAHPTTSLHHVGVRVDAHPAPLRHHCASPIRLVPGGAASSGTDLADPMDRQVVCRDDVALLREGTQV